MEATVKRQIKEMGLVQSHVFDVFVRGLNKYFKRSIYIDSTNHKYYIVFMGRLMEVECNESEWYKNSDERHIIYLHNFYTVEKVSRYEYDEWKYRY